MMKTRMYAPINGIPPYVIIAKVNHQQVPKKKPVPNIQPTTAAPKTDCFSRSIAIKNGTNPNHAKKERSKSGNANVKNMTDKIENNTLFTFGIFDRKVEIFILTVYQKFTLVVSAELTAENRISQKHFKISSLGQFERLPFKLSGHFD